MVSHYLCNELNEFGPNTRAGADTWEWVQQRQAGCPGTGAQGIPGKLKELGCFILENRWLLGSHRCLQLPDGPEIRQSQSILLAVWQRNKFWINVRNYSWSWVWSSTESREAMHVLPQCHWEHNWKRKALGTLTCLWLWPCFDQGWSQRSLESSYNLNYFIYIVLI